jgi:predicted  nucleic acid-binding Zn-ribbon protein
MKATELLLQYQRLGDRLATLGDEQRHLEARLARDDRVEAAAAAAVAAQEARDGLAESLKAMEHEVEGHRTQMKGHERELMSGRIRSPSDLTRMSEEVGHMKSRLLDEEDRELELMTALETAEAELSAARAEEAEAQAARDAATPVSTSRLEAIGKEVVEVQAQQESLWEGIPAPLQAAYRKISRVPHPVVAMVDGQCEGCRVRLTTNELQLLRRGERFTCQNCNRILVLS